MLGDPTIHKQQTYASREYSYSLACFVAAWTAFVWIMLRRKHAVSLPFRRASNDVYLAKSEANNGDDDMILD